jgi:hypothetical protein
MSQRWMMLFLGLGRGGDVIVGRPVSETLGLRSRMNRRCSKTPCEASDEAGRWAGLFTCLAGGPTKEDFSPSLFC